MVNSQAEALRVAKRRRKKGYVDRLQLPQLNYTLRVNRTFQDGDILHVNFIGGDSRRFIYVDGEFKDLEETSPHPDATHYDLSSVTGVV